MHHTVSNSMNVLLQIEIIIKHVLNYATFYYMYVMLSIIYLY